MKCQRLCLQLPPVLLNIGSFNIVAHSNNNLALFNDYDELIDFNSPYFIAHLITYIGNKRKLLPFLNSAFCDVKRQLSKSKLTTLDGFSGSGVVSRLLKYHSDKLISNDLEEYAETINKAYLSNKEDVDSEVLKESIQYLNKNKRVKSSCEYFITNNYAPKVDQSIKPGERVFYTSTNAKIIDNIRYLISTSIPDEAKIYCLANLLVKASIHTNTSGVFKGFHKKNGIGHFGGRGENALSRIMAEIELEVPIFSEISCNVEVTRKDTNKLVTEIEPLDLAYFDPPYNQHPYGSNYFMLNIINAGIGRPIQDGVSGIAKDWNKSDYNKKRIAVEAMDKLISDTRAKFVAISYNNEGIIPIDTFQKTLEKHGKWTLYEQEYNTYRGSRNLRDRNTKVQELLWVLNKK